MKYRYLILFLLTLPALSFGEGRLEDAKVVNVRVDKNGKGYVRFDRGLQGTPASCISGHPEHLAFDLNTPGGQGIMSMALAAKATGKSIKARGTGSCDVYGSVESWSWGYIYN